MIIYGKQVVLYVLKNHPNIIEEVMFSKEIENKTFNQFLTLSKKIIKLDNKKAQSLAQGGNHQGFFLKLNKYTFTPINHIKKDSFILVLDGLTDVGNIGAITRSAYALGINSIIVSGIKSIKEEAIIRTSSGAFLDIAFNLYQNNSELLNELKQSGFTLIGATKNGVDLTKYQKVDKSDKVALILGNENTGLCNKIEKKLDLKVSIKMHNKFDSLNVSVAAGILMYNLTK